MPPTTSVRVRLFAQIREIAGQSDLWLPVAEVSTAAGVRERLSARFPEAAPLLARSAVAVNLEYVPDHHPVQRGDDVAVIPPVAGG